MYRKTPVSLGGDNAFVIIKRAAEAVAASLRPRRNADILVRHATGLIEQALPVRTGVEVLVGPQLDRTALLQIATRRLPQSGKLRPVHHRVLREDFVGTIITVDGYPRLLTRITLIGCDQDNAVGAP